jgi:hypothetical protein
MKEMDANLKSNAEKRHAYGSLRETPSVEKITSKNM